MSNRKLGLKSLGLAFLAALAFSAFAASGAQADEWRVGGAGLGHGAKSILGLGNEGKLLSIGLNIECSSSHIQAGSLIHELDRGLATILFLGCNFMEGSPLKLSEVCSINAAKGKPGTGSIEASVKFLAFLHNSEVYVLFEPDNTNGTLNERTFTTINIVDSTEGSEECVLAGPKAVKGTQIGLVTSGTTSQLGHEVQVVNNASLFPADFLHIGANAATLEGGSISVDLVSDENWAFS